jgi:hypothetical protein
MTDLAKAIAAQPTPFCDKHESATPSGAWVLDIDDARSLERERAYALALLRRWESCCFTQEAIQLTADTSAFLASLEKP